MLWKQRVTIAQVIKGRSLVYRAVLGLTALQKKYGKERLEKASCVAWHYNAPDRRFIDNLLRHHRENQELPLSRQSEQHAATSPEHENLRGPGYYHCKR